MPYSWLGGVNSVERTERGDGLEDGLSTAELGACLKDSSTQEEGAVAGFSYSSGACWGRPGVACQLPQPGLG